MTGILSVADKLLRDACRTSLTLFKITIPISILTKLAAEAGLVDQLGIALGPVMEIVGLPGSMGLVWATAMVTHLYGGMIVFASIAPGADLTVAQVTVLTTMMLVAHALPVELRIAQKAGPRFRVMALLRLGSAFLLGWILYQIYSLTGSLQTANKSLFPPVQANPTWFGWLVGELRNLVAIFLIILCLLAVMKLLERLGVTALLTRFLEPVLSAMGMSRAAAPVTIIGMTLGLSYGGGLILQEARSGRLSQRDIFFSLAFMGLCHSIVDDTLLMMVFGGHLSGILWARVLFALLVIFLLVRVFRRLPAQDFERYCFRTAGSRSLPDGGS